MIKIPTTAKRCSLRALKYRNNISRIQRYGLSQRQKRLLDFNKGVIIAKKLINSTTLSNNDKHIILGVYRKVKGWNCKCSVELLGGKGFLSSLSKGVKKVKRKPRDYYWW